MSVSAPRPISLEEYLTFERLAEARHEYLDGTVYPRGDSDHPLDPAVVLGLRPEPHSPMAGRTRAHSRIKINLTVAIDGHLGDGPCRLYDSDLRIRSDGSAYFYADLFVVCAAEHGENDDIEVENPTLIIEVLSPGTERVDRMTKARRYTHAPSLCEYVLVNSRFPEIVVRRLEEGRWLGASYQPDESVRLESIALDLDFATVYRNVQLPPA